MKKKTKLYIAPVHLALKNGHFDAIRALVNQGADLNQKQSDGRTLLHEACRRSNFEQVKFLLEEYKEKINIMVKDVNGESSAMISAKLGNNHILEEIFKFASNSTTISANFFIQKDSRDQNFFHIAAGKNSARIVDLLFKYCSNQRTLVKLLSATKESLITSHFKLSNTPVHAALSLGNKEFVQAVMHNVIEMKKKSLPSDGKNSLTMSAVDISFLSDEAILEILSSILDEFKEPATH